MAIGSIVVDCAHLCHPDAGTVDAIARMQLAARRCGCEIRLERPARSLRELIEFCGLAGVLRLEPGRQPEEREEPGGVEEERDLGDPTL